MTTLSSTSPIDSSGCELTPAADAVAQLELRQLACERDERLLFSGLDLQVRAGDIVQIEGPNGSGKTSLLRILTTSSHDYRGQLLWRGRELPAARLDYLNHLLYIGHLAGVKKALTPRENLRWFSGMNSGHQQLALEQALEQVGLYGYEDLPCYQLSAGQLRRVALARLYLAPNPVWILDEPFTAIDKQGVANLEALLREHTAGGGSVILTTHQPLDIEGLKRVNLQDYAATVAPVDEVGL